MPARNEPTPMTPAAISVSEMARRLTLSRGRFYELVQAGVFPSPCFCIHTRRALYPAELIQQCLQVRQTNIGVNGRYVLFYQQRASIAVASRPRLTGNRSRAADPALSSLREGLAALGMAGVADEQIYAAMRAAFPSGTEGIDAGTVIAAVFRQLRSPNDVRLPSTS